METRYDDRVPFLSFLQPTYLLAALAAITVHEAAHAFAAKRLGDRTAEIMGRLTLNPLAHLDLLGSILFLTVGFGWAKPVPVDPRYLRHPIRDMALVALAGPASNLVLAAVAYLALAAVAPALSDVQLMALMDGNGVANPFLAVLLQFLRHSIFVNLALMAFNLLPIAPLDGSKILQPFVPLNWADLYDEFLMRGPYVLLVLILAGDFLALPLLSDWVFGISGAVLAVFEWLTPWW